MASNTKRDVLAKGNGSGVVKKPQIPISKFQPIPRFQNPNSKLSGVATFYRTVSFGIINLKSW